jgi:hypothetical protein
MRGRLRFYKSSRVFPAVSILLKVELSTQFVMVLPGNLDERLYIEGAMATRALFFMILLQMIWLSMFVKVRWR